MNPLNESRNYYKAFIAQNDILYHSPFGPDTAELDSDVRELL